MESTTAKYAAKAKTVKITTPCALDLLAARPGDDTHFHAQVIHVVAETAGPGERAPGETSRLLLSTFALAILPFVFAFTGPEPATDSSR